MSSSKITEKYRAFKHRQQQCPINTDVSFVVLLRIKVQSVTFYTAIRQACYSLVRRPLDLVECNTYMRFRLYINKHTYIAVKK